MVRKPRFNAWDLSLTPGQGTKLPQVTWPKNKGK